MSMPSSLSFLIVQCILSFCLALHYVNFYALAICNASVENRESSHIDTTNKKIRISSILILNAIVSKYLKIITSQNKKLLQNRFLVFNEGDILLSSSYEKMMKRGRKIISTYTQNCKYLKNELMSTSKIFHFI